MMQERMIIHNPPEGSPKANRPKRKTQANMENSITCLIPKRFKKKGIARINNVSEICEIDMMMVEYFTTNESAYAGTFEKFERNLSPYMLVNCRAAPKSMENTKNSAIL